MSDSGGAVFLILLLGALVVVGGVVEVVRHRVATSPVTLAQMGLTNHSHSAAIKCNRQQKTCASVQYIDITNDSDSPHMLRVEGPFVSIDDAYQNRRIISLILRDNGADPDVTVEAHSRLRLSRRVSSDQFWGYDVDTMKPGAQQVVISMIDGHHVRGIKYDKDGYPVFG